MNIKTPMIFFAILLTSISCGHRHVEYTPKNYVNKVKVTRNQYSQDSVHVLITLQKLLKDQLEFFDNSAYFEGTGLIIDTIVYSPDLQKIGVIIMTMNPNFRQLDPDRSSKFYFDATCYLGVRQSDSILLSWRGPNFSNSPDQSDLSKTVRETYFNELARSDTMAGRSPIYNLNDLRLWTSPIWKKMEERRTQRKEFEAFRLKYPERVYEPK